MNRPETFIFFSNQDLEAFLKQTNDYQGPLQKDYQTLAKLLPRLLISRIEVISEHPDVANVMGPVTEYAYALNLATFLDNKTITGQLKAILVLFLLESKVTKSAELLTLPCVPLPPL